MNKEKYLDEVDESVHKSIVKALETIYDVAVNEEDTEETRELLMHERMLASA